MKDQKILKTLLVKTLLVGLFSYFCLACSYTAFTPFAVASDWGYDQLESSPAVTSSPLHNHESLAPSLTEPELLKLALTDWIQIYEFIYNNQFTPQQKAQYLDLLTSFANPKNQELVSSVLSFWPQTQMKMQTRLEQAENYRDLFRALLKVQLRLAPDTIVGGKDLACDILGPLRIAATGDPPLTEDAINAYSDMACFLFEQQHTGRTMDVAENRALFAKIITDKFKQAPTLEAKIAMVNFDLNFACFKIVWTEANQTQRSELLKKLTEYNFNGPLTNQTINLIFTKGPWKLALSRTIFLSKHGIYR